MDVLFSLIILYYRLLFIISVATLISTPLNRYLCFHSSKALFKSVNNFIYVRVSYLMFIFQSTQIDFGVFLEVWKILFSTARVYVGLMVKGK